MSFRRTHERPKREMGEEKTFRMRVPTLHGGLCMFEKISPRPITHSLCRSFEMT